MDVCNAKRRSVFHFRRGRGGGVDGVEVTPLAHHPEGYSISPD